MLSVAVAVRFRNPPPSPAPPVYIGYGVIHVSYIWGLFHTVYVICAAAVFLTCSQQHVVDVLAVVASLCTCSAAAATQQIYSAKTKHTNIGMYITC